MPAVSELLANLQEAPPGIPYRICLALLPTPSGNPEPSALLDLRGVADRDEALEPIQLLEGAEYRYRFLTPRETTVLTTDHPEVFAADDDRGLSGRLRPGLFTGTMRVKVLQGGIHVGTVAFEVRSKKLDYITDYRRMLADIADKAVEVVMDRFAPSAQSFTPAERGDSQALYQRFCFLQSLFASEPFQAALRQVIARPYEAWERVEETRSIGQGLRADSQLSRQLASSGPKLPWPSGPADFALPIQLRIQRTEATLDNVPNRFVKFALIRWRELVGLIQHAITENDPSASVTRGRRESQELIDRLDALLAEEVFREVGDLPLFPAGNQVLQKREGYRDIFRAYVQFEVAALLSWEGGEDVYSGGQRNVAALYEYWAYLQIATIVADLCQSPFAFENLLEVRDGGLSLDLKRGRRRVLSGVCVRLGRRLIVEMWFNRAFRGGSEVEEGSWTIGMQPDFSIKVTPDRGDLEYCDPVWVHFDAKYKVGSLDIASIENGLYTGNRPAEGPSSGSDTQAKPEDVHKMHAYKDAIRRSVGAYILYPGNTTQLRQAYEEILPGLGAFSLRPSVTGAAEGVEAIRGFLNSILSHLANQASQHERVRFWTSKIYDGRATQARVGPARFLTQPPSDTRVLVGFVKSLPHAEWISKTRRYNLRADGRRGSVSRDLLDCDLLLLWGSGLGSGLWLWRVGKDVETMSAEELRAAHYPEPEGATYYCLRLTAKLSNWAERGWDARWIEERLAEVAPRSVFGSPLRITWSQLVRSSNARA